MHKRTTKILDKKWKDSQKDNALITFRISKKLLADFDKCGKDYRYMSRSEAIRELIRYEVETQKDLQIHKNIENLFNEDEKK